MSLIMVLGFLLLVIGWGLVSFTMHLSDLPQGHRRMMWVFSVSVVVIAHLIVFEGTTL